MADALIDSQVPVKSGGAGMLKKSFPGLSFLDNLSEMTMLRQIGLLVGLAASVAIGFAVVLWSQQPDYKPLYGSLNGVDANRVVEALKWTHRSRQFFSEFKLRRLLPLQLVGAAP